MNAPVRNLDTTADGVIKLAIMAVGGQGGGVLANWVAALADKGGYAAQMTSVAGVAQRTGATIYYIEMAPRTDRMPIFALAPAGGDVDILIASELMEAGRAVMRGFVTPDRTTLIASTHRILAISEKEIPGDGRGDGGGVLERVQAAALKAECFDMEALATENGSFISASLFGGLARSGALPFDRALFEEVIGGSAKGAERSLAAFRAAADYTETPDAPVLPKSKTVTIEGPPDQKEAWEKLVAQLEEFPAAGRPILRRGLEKVVDYQDTEYGEEYLGHVRPFAARGHDPLTKAAAKYLANVMCYDDILRVADLKTRASRQARLRKEQQTGDGMVQVTEYLHPRGEEVISIMPARLGAWFEAKESRAKLLDRLVNKGRRIRTDRIGGFLVLWLAAALRSRRRSLLRHQVEAAHLQRLITAAMAAPDDVAVEILGVPAFGERVLRYPCEGGMAKFDLAMVGVALVAGREDAADWIRRIREAALSGEGTEGIEGALETVRSFA